MLEITKFNPENSLSVNDVDFSKFNPYARICIKKTLVGLDESGKLQEIATFTVSYSKNPRTGLENVFTLLEVFHDKNVYLAVSKCGGCGYDKGLAGVNNCFNKLFTTNDPHVWHDTLNILYTIAEFFGIKQAMII